MKAECVLNVGLRFPRRATPHEISPIVEIASHGQAGGAGSVRAYCALLGCEPSILNLLFARFRHSPTQAHSRLGGTLANSMEIGGQCLRVVYPAMLEALFIRVGTIEPRCDAAQFRGVVGK